MACAARCCPAHAARESSCCLAAGESGIKCPSPLNVLKDTHNHSCHSARSDENQHLMTDSPTATAAGAPPRAAPAAAPLPGGRASQPRRAAAASWVSQHHPPWRSMPQHAGLWWAGLCVHGPWARGQGGQPRQTGSASTVRRGAACELAIIGGDDGYGGAPSMHAAARAGLVVGWDVARGLNPQPQHGGRRTALLRGAGALPLPPVVHLRHLGQRNLGGHGR